MSTKVRQVALIATTIAAWVLAAADAVLPDAWINLTDGMSVFICTAAATGSLVLAGWARSRPVAEVYAMGEAAGYRQAKIDAAAKRVRSGVVVPFKRNGTGG